MLNKYTANEINYVIEQNSDSDACLRLVIKGEGCTTKHLNITDDQAKQISDILTEKKTTEAKTDTGGFVGIKVTCPNCEAEEIELVENLERT